MSTRTSLRPQAVITAGNMVGNLTSLPTILQSMPLVSYSCTWTGTAPVGTVSIQVSNDYALTAGGTVANAGTWTFVTLSVEGFPTQTAPVTGNTGVGFVNLSDLAAYAVRLIYTATSGTGTFNAIVNGKVS